MIGLGAALESVLAILDRMEIAYFVGGSVASSNYGMPRLTNDIDLVVELEGVDLDEFCAALSRDFYVDLEAVRQGATNGRAFNAIHLAAAFKFDFFPVAGNEFFRAELMRRRAGVSRVPGMEGIEFAMASPEDVLLAKLVWYRKGGEISERQWHDILGILRVQGSRLDRVYLEGWAEKLGVADLLSRCAPRA